MAWLSFMAMKIARAILFGIGSAVEWCGACLICVGFVVASLGIAIADYATGDA